MKKILHVAETIKGGVATVLRQLSADREGFDIHCIVPDDQSSELNSSSASIYTFHRSGRNLSSFISLAKTFSQVYRKERPDIVHIHSSFAGVICRFLLPILPGNPKIIYCPHAFSFLMDTSEAKKKIYAVIEKALSFNTDKIVCVSQYEHDEAVAYGLKREKLAIIYNGVEEPVKPAAAEQMAEKSTEGELNVLFVGRLDYQKGFDVVTDVANRLQGKCKIVVVGGGVHSNPELSHVKNITYAGWVGKKDIGKYYSEADVLLMPSRWESFGLVAVEAQSYGLPVVASRCSSIPEVVKENVTGFLFPIGDVNEVCRILLAHDKDEWGRMSSAAINYYQENFTSNKMVEKTFHLYKN